MNNSIMNNIGFTGFFVADDNNRGRKIKIVVDEKWDCFFDELLSAICLAGGNNNKEHWKSMSIEDVYKTLAPNGILLTFRMDANKIKDRVFG